MEVVPVSYRFLKSKVLIVISLLAVFITAVACSDDAKPQPTPTPIDIAAMTTQIQQALQGTLTDLTAGAVTREDIESVVSTAIAAIPSPSAAVSAAEIQTMVSAAVRAAIPAEASADEIRRLVTDAVAAATTGAATQEGVTQAIADAVAQATAGAVTQKGVTQAITKAVTDAAAAAPKPLTDADIERVVKASLPTPTPTLAPTPTRVPAPSILILATHDVPAGLDIRTTAGGTRSGQEAKRNMADFPIRYARTPTADGNFRVDTSEFEGRLMESWSVSPDGQTYTFNVRQGVMSNLGNELTAEDFRYFMERIMTGPFTIWRFVIGGHGLSNLDQVEVTDRYTIKFTLPKPDSAFIHSNTLFRTIEDSTEVKKHITDDDPIGLTWTGNNTAHFGAYTHTRTEQGVALEFEPNPNYWDGTPNNARVIIRRVPDASTRTSLMLAGVVDIAWGLGVDELSRLVGVPGVKIVQDPDNLVGLESNLVMNNGRAPFDNVLVRKAIAHAIPYDDIIQGVFGGNATKSHNLLRPIDFGNDTSKDWYTYDIDMARQLLAEAGLADGFSTSVIMSERSATGQNLLLAVKTSLAEIGIDMAIDIRSEAVFRGISFQNPKPYDMFLEDISRAFVPHPLFVYTHFWQPPGVSCCNGADYINDEVTTLLTQALASPDEAEVISTINQIQDIIMEDIPIVPIVYVLDRVAVRENISGIVWEAAVWADWAAIVKAQ
jgi:ABC-type transport system substrate-binding protein